ncbi:hypothetical protein D9I26_05250 [Escherichia coli]|nr:hypothetical protein [Escherichia coli]
MCIGLFFDKNKSFKNNALTSIFHSYYRTIKINKLPHIQLHHAFLLCHISAIVTLAISQNTVLTSGSAGADI